MRTSVVIFTKEVIFLPWLVSRMWTDFLEIFVQMVDRGTKTTINLILGNMDWHLSKRK